MPRKPRNSPRKPIGNFFIKRSLQTRLIAKIVIAVLISTLVCAGTLLATYYIKFQSVAFYRVILNHDLDIPPRENIIFIILPSLAISAAVNLIVAIFIGLYASRKYAVPIYKLEQWAGLLKSGKISAKLRFREREEFKELSGRCNMLSEFLQDKFLIVKKETDAMKGEGVRSPHLEAIAAALSALDVEAQPFEVHTGMFAVPESGAAAPGSESRGS